MKSDEEIQKQVEDVIAAALRGGIILTTGERPFVEDSVAENVRGVENAPWN